MRKVRRDAGIVGLEGSAVDLDCATPYPGGVSRFSMGAVSAWPSGRPASEGTRDRLPRLMNRHAPIEPAHRAPCRPRRRFENPET